MNPFPPSSSGAIIYEQLEPSLEQLDLVRRAPIHPHLIEHIQSVPLDELLGRPIRNRSMAEATKAGLYVMVDAWDEAHVLSQELETVEGSYWHGIIHRREPDSSNAAYWFRRVGQHPVFQQLADPKVREVFHSRTVFEHIIQSGAWDPFKFIEMCAENAASQESEQRAELLFLQIREMKLLLGYCIQGAIKN